MESAHIFFARNGCQTQSLAMPWSVIIVAMLATSQLASAEEKAGSQSFRDCPDCPEMVALPEKGFAIGKYEVTFDEWDACVADGGCNGYTPPDGSRGAHWGRGKRPVIYVSWDDAQSYIQWLSKKSGKTYRLLKETEWEYACNGATPSEYCGGKDIKGIAWFEDNSENQTHPVGQKQANAFGLHDMSGNVWEWMDDCWDAECSARVMRGGAWMYDKYLVRAVTRLRFLQTLRSSTYGFRLAKTLP